MGLQLPPLCLLLPFFIDATVSTECIAAAAQFAVARLALAVILNFIMAATAAFSNAAAATLLSVIVATAFLSLVRQEYCVFFAVGH